MPKIEKVSRGESLLVEVKRMLEEVAVREISPLIDEVLNIIINELLAN